MNNKSSNFNESLSQGLPNKPARNTASQQTNKLFGVPGPETLTEPIVPNLSLISLIIERLVLSHMDNWTSNWIYNVFVLSHAKCLVGIPFENMQS